MNVLVSNIFETLTYTLFKSRYNEIKMKKKCILNFVMNNICYKKAEFVKLFSFLPLADTVCMRECVVAGIHEYNVYGKIMCT